MGVEHPGQQFNTAIGTAFAFLVKAAFVLAVSTAYYQVFWKRAKQDSKIDKPPSLARLDTTFSATTSIISLFNIFVWFRYPLLFLMAATVWLIPIASIITPATLSVSLRENVANSTMQQVPQIDFSNLNFLAGMPSTVRVNGISLFYTYNGVSQLAKKIAMGVAAQNAILPISAPFPNSSWALSFSGASLKCNPVSSSDSLNFQANIAQYVKNPANCNTAATYLAWFPRFDPTQNKSLMEPYPQIAQGDSSFPNPQAIFDIGIGNFSKLAQDATLYIAVIPNMLSINPDNPLGLVGGNVTMLQCQLHNSTDHTKFNYVNGAQTVSINLAKQETDETVPVINFVRGPGSGKHDAGMCTTLNEVDDVYGRTCVFDGSLLSRLSYQAILQAFAMLVTGNITLVKNTNGLSDSTSIRSTSLLNTKELQYLTDYALHANTPDMQPDLQNKLRLSNMSEVSGMSRIQQTTSNQLLQDAIETMFQNFTVSLMSSSALQYACFHYDRISYDLLIEIRRPVYNSAGAPPKTMVTQFTSQTVYVYAADKLWAAYGVAAIFTLCSVTVGILTILADGASYSNTFSTVLRVSRAAELSTEVKESDLDGRDPVPSYLAKATVSTSRRKDQGDSLNWTKESVNIKGLPTRMAWWT
ncbi:MAG: hypothetical protein M1836_003086 [Candelina mexicana]|nr:MAG: hypothetical protein M1836_003086 [Candelina mexicana]